MVTQIWRRRRAEAAPEKTEPERTEPGRIFTRHRPVEAVPRTVLVDRRTARKLRTRRHNVVSAAIWLVALAAVLVLLLGMLLSFAGANPDNDIIHTIMRAGTWLASPFHDVFLDSDPDRQLYVNWGIAAAVYLLIGRALSWLVRR
jgi:hypothetical protein